MIQGTIPKLDKLRVSGEVFIDSDTWISPPDFLSYNVCGEPRETAF
jgi:hypothetical protein